MKIQYAVSRRTLTPYQDMEYYILKISNVWSYPRKANTPYQLLDKPYWNRLPDIINRKLQRVLSELNHILDPKTQKLIFKRDLRAVEEDGKITTWEELVEKFFCRFYPESYDGEDEMLDEGEN
ncbi:hypothetical protein Tco_1359985 [Tanacetum coccineum]